MSFGQGITPSGTFRDIALDESGAIKTVPGDGANAARENYTTSRIAANTGGAFGSVACSILDIRNTAQGAVDVQYQVGGTGEWIDVPAGYSDTVRGITNANQVAVRRTDGGAAVTIKAITYAVAA